MATNYPKIDNKSPHKNDKTSNQGKLIAHTACVSRRVMGAGGVRRVTGGTDEVVMRVPPSLERRVICWPHMVGCRDYYSNGSSAKDVISSLWEPKNTE